MKIFVYTYDESDRNLPGFAHCFNKYWSSWVDVTVLGYRFPPHPLPPNFRFQCLNSTGVCDKPWSYYLYRWLSDIEDDYFVFAGDDHWISGYVDLGAVAMLEGAVRNGAAKANMSSDGGIYFARRKGHMTGELMVLPAKHAAEGEPPLNWKYSLLPAIWKRSYLLNALKEAGEPEGCSPWKFEGCGRRTPNRTADRVVSCVHSVWPMTGKEGVQHKGESYPPNILALGEQTLWELQLLGYLDIHKGSLQRHFAPPPDESA